MFFVSLISPRLYYEGMLYFVEGFFIVSFTYEVAFVFGAKMFSVARSHLFVSGSKSNHIKTVSIKSLLGPLALTSYWLALPF